MRKADWENSPAYNEWLNDPGYWLLACEVYDDEEQRDMLFDLLDASIVEYRKQVAARVRAAVTRDAMGLFAWTPEQTEMNLSRVFRLIEELEQNNAK